MCSIYISIATYRQQSKRTPLFILIDQEKNQWYLSEKFYLDLVFEVASEDIGGDFLDSDNTRFVNVSPVAFFAYRKYQVVVGKH